MVTCKVCGAPSQIYLQNVRVLSKYSITYYRCESCQLIQTEEPFWLNEAYRNAITSLDIGLPRRNLHWLPVVETVIRKWFDPAASFVDYGGGYGLFVRLMRDQGFNFYRQDTYCENLFAKNFDITDLPETSTHELVTAFEVFEHLSDPISTVKDMLRYGHSILFSTVLQPHDNVTPDNWWYFIPDTGQHVCLYTEASLRKLAAHFNVHLYTNGATLHLLTSKPVSATWFRQLSNPKFAKLYNQLAPNRRQSLLDSDYALIAPQLSTIA